MGAFAAAVAVLPAEALLFKVGSLRFRSDVLRRRGSAMSLAEGVSADDERDRFLVVHRHARERAPDHFRRGGGIRFAARTLRVHVDQAHVIGSERSLKIPITIVGVPLVTEPGVFWPPENFVRLPDIGPAEAEAER